MGKQPTGLLSGGNPVGCRPTTLKGFAGFECFVTSSSNLCFSAHVGLQGFRDSDAAVGAEVVLQKGNQHARRSNYRIIQGVGEVVAVLAFDSDLQATCLGIAKIGAAAHLEVFLLAR